MLLNDEWIMPSSSLSPPPPHSLYVFLKKNLPGCICSQVMVIVLGNKTDLREQRQVDQEAAQQWARGEKVKLWEVSVTERNSLIEPFTQLTSRLTQPQSKSAFPLPGRKSKGTPSNDIWRTLTLTLSLSLFQAKRTLRGSGKHLKDWRYIFFFRRIDMKLGLLAWRKDRKQGETSPVL